MKKVIVFLGLIVFTFVFYVYRREAKYFLLNVVSVEQKNGLIPMDSILWCSFPNPNNVESGGVPFNIMDVTHPSIVYIPQSWGGHSLWAATSPYPQTIDGDKYENTCVFYSSIKARNGSIGFTPVSSNPIIQKPIDAFNSDPDIFFDKKTDKLFVLTRQCNDSIKIVIQSSEDGVAWSKEKLIISGLRGDGYLSPCLFLKDSVYYIMTFMKTPENRGLVKTANIYSCQDLENANFTFEKSLELIGDVNVWHGDIFEYDDQLYAIVCGSNLTFKYLHGKADVSKYLFLGKLDSDFNIQFSSVPLIKGNGVYRSTGFVDGSGVLHAYFSFHYRYLDDKVQYPSGHRIAYFKSDFSDMLKSVFIE